MSAHELQPSASASASVSDSSLRKRQEPIYTEKSITEAAHNSLNDAFGGLEARIALEKKLLLKIDLRMSVRRHYYPNSTFLLKLSLHQILVVLYILNFVRDKLYQLDITKP